MRTASFSSLSTIALLSLLVGQSTSNNVVARVPADPDECTVDYSSLQSGQEIAVNVVSAHPEDYGYWLVDFLNGTLAGMSGIPTWCIDADRNIGEKIYSMDTFSSLDDQSNFPYASGVVDRPNLLPGINFLINNYPVGTTMNQCPDAPNVSSADFQVAVWKVIDTAPDPYLLVEGENQCVVDALVEIAIQNNEFEPDCRNENELIGLILIVDNDDTGEIERQVLISEIPVPCVCSEMPSPLPSLYLGAGGRTMTPSLYPSPAPSPQPSGVNGDPHFKTWSGEKYDFHGVCDLVLLHNPNFRDGIGMDIHVRSKLWKQWSYVSTAAIRIGLETFEVSGLHDGDTYWINGVRGENIQSNEDNEKKELSIAGYPIKFRKVHKFVREYVIKLRTEESIVIKTWKDFVRVDIVGIPREEDFEGSFGLMGSFPSGKKIGRDLVTEVRNVNDFGQQWQVGHRAGNDSSEPDPELFHNVEGPQFPARCEVPTKTALRRRLAESSISRERAEIACSRVVDKTEFDLCVFDVIVTDNEDSASAH